jgi:hypothetical protein
LSDRPLNSASGKSVRQRKKTAAFLERAKADRLRRLLKIEDFLVHAWDYLGHAGVFTQVDVESTNRVLVNEGQRRVGLRFLAECEVAHPGALELMRAAHFRQKDRP